MNTPHMLDHDAAMDQAAKTWRPVRIDNASTEDTIKWREAIRQKDWSDRLLHLAPGALVTSWVGS